MKAIITAGLGYGDEGKGSIVDALVRKYKSQLVVRYSGGHQCGHNVVLPNGTSHCFSQFGAGTLAGATTYLDRDVIVDPIALRYEKKHLSEIGFPKARIIINPDCLVTTEYHKLKNRLNKKNTCGLGIGETRRLWLNNIALKVKDLRNVDLTLEKLWLIREFYETERYMGELDLKLPSPYKVLQEIIKNKTAFEYGNFTNSLINIKNNDIIIFEGAQGILLNQDVKENGQYTGTWSDVTARNAVELCQFYNIDYQILGVARTYLTRHGGYLNDKFYKEEQPPVDSHNPNHPFQGEMQYGLWGKLLQKSVDKVQPDFLAINHYDHKPLENDLSIPILIKGFGPTYHEKIFTEGVDM